MRDVGCEMRDAGFGMRDAGCGEMIGAAMEGNGMNGKEFPLKNIRPAPRDQCLLLPFLPLRVSIPSLSRLRFACFPSTEGGISQAQRG